MAEHRTEEYEVTRADGTICTVWHDIDTGETRVLATRPGPKPRDSGAASKAILKHDLPVRRAPFGQRG